MGFPKKKKISIVSNKDGGITYDNGFKDLTIEKMVYNIYKFKFNDFVNYKLDDKTLYYNVYNSDLNVKVFDGDVKDLVKVDGNTVYFVSGDSLYSYTYGEKVVLLLKYFEWNLALARIGILRLRIIVYRFQCLIAGKQSCAQTHTIGKIYLLDGTSKGRWRF